MAIRMAEMLLGIALAALVGYQLMQNDSSWTNEHVIISAQVERLEWSPDRPFAEFLASQNKPVILTNTVVDTWKARQTWKMSDMRQVLRESTLEGVYRHSNRFFGPFFDENRPMASFETVLPRNQYESKVKMRTKQFIEHALAGGEPYLYYSGEIDRFDERILEDIHPIQELLALQPSRTSVNLWMGQEGVVAPCHFDGYYNMYVQLDGKKRFLLFPPTEADSLYVFPFLHPSYAQCQANISADPSDRFPRSTQATAVEAVLEPGDLLYLPPLWFHQVTALTPSVSVNAWTDPPEAALAAELLQVPLPMQMLLDDTDPALVGVLSAATISSVLKACAYDPHDFVARLYQARYADLITQGELSGALVPSGAAAVCTTDPSSRPSLDPQMLAAVAQYVTDVSSRALELPEATRALWLGNLMEYIAARTAGIRGAGVFLREVSGCMRR